MLTLNLSSIFLNQSAEDKLQVIELIGQKMVEVGYTTEAYTAGLKAREAISSTFLGNGIAIPHGTPDSRDAVLQTGVVILQFPKGVDWGEGEKVFMAVGIAARSNEHLQILSGLTRVLDNDDLCLHLAKTDNPEDVIEAINPQSKQRTLISEKLVQCRSEVNTPFALKAVAASMLGAEGYLESGAEEALASTHAIVSGSIAFISTAKATSTGIALITPAVPISFAGKSVNLLVAVSACDSTHVSILKEIGSWSDDALLADKLEKIAPADLLNAAKGQGWPIPSEDVLSREFIIFNPNGMHARPGKVFVSTIKPFESRIEVRNPDKGNAFINGKSLMKLLSLGITKGTTIEVKASGPDAQAAMGALEQAISEGLGE
ncbi:fused PTS fructose transporter subunit IIA/HPr protein [Endozoicomonas arenosclerae]|uniref:fused PTS fructose transporter subunit IIA/HPr protein n=1 Tax=Endozoicomonas arenosclerae TaxID=1633495 RepID=UPI000780E6B8|nr:fused PTS fructose transporter subunit IIA/HPr protein [Endozoicomonas arenosclerae]